MVMSQSISKAEFAEKLFWLIKESGGVTFKNTKLYDLSEDSLFTINLAGSFLTYFLHPITRELVFVSTDRKDIESESSKDDDFITSLTSLLDDAGVTYISSVAYQNKPGEYLCARFRDNEENVDTWNPNAIMFRVDSNTLSFEEVVRK